MNRNALVFAAVAAALCAVPFAAPGYKTSLATEMLIFAALPMSIDVLARDAGRTSLGHGAIFGIAAYTVLYYVTVAVWNPVIAARLRGLDALFHRFRAPHFPRPRGRRAVRLFKQFREPRHGGAGAVGGSPAHGARRRSRHARRQLRRVGRHHLAGELRQLPHRALAT